MTARAFAVVAVLGVLVWVACALVVAIAVCRTIRPPAVPPRLDVRL